ncbi:MAG: energy transducer TonB [Deltaproteobacteria bacterium]|nr:energy transducer TonB [Deltaproteobacteria bacterium]
MAPPSKGRHSVAFVVSAIIHATVALALIVVPMQLEKKSRIVDMSIHKAEPKKEALPPPPPPEPVKPRIKAPKEAEPPPEPPPDQPPEPPPTFNMGDNTFATGGGAWALNRSEGTGNIGAVAGKFKPGPPKPTIAPAGDAFRPVPLKDLSKPPEPESGSIGLPPYPEDARRQGIEGAVVLQVFIARTGHVTRVRIIKDPGGGLGAVAQSAMLKESWKPGRDKAGQAVDTVIAYSYRFVLDG